MKDKTLLVITGPTASGKTALAVDLALSLKTEIVSADSRQMFRDIPIGTAQPSAEELAAVRHHLIGFLPLDAYYSASVFEKEVTQTLLPDIFSRSDYAVMVGGSMLYIDAVTKGLDAIPDISPEVRAAAHNLLETSGLDAVREELRRLDPAYFARADLNNTSRMVHALEVCRQTGVPYSSLLTGRRADRPWRTVVVALNPPRDVLFDRINRRVDAMISAGLEEEAARCYPLRHLNSLNTVGYKELFAMMDGTLDRDTAIARIGKNTRVYAKKQLTWLRRDPDAVAFLDPAQPAVPQALALLNKV